MHLLRPPHHLILMRPLSLMRRLKRPLRLMRPLRHWLNVQGRATRLIALTAALFASSSDSDSDYSAASDVAAAAEPLAKQAGGRKLPAKKGKAGTETKKNPAKKAKTTVDKVCHQ
jgi:hypothetical protein